MLELGLQACRSEKTGSKDSRISLDKGTLPAECLQLVGSGYCMACCMGMEAGVLDLLPISSGGSLRVVPCCLIHHFAGQHRDSLFLSVLVDISPQSLL